MCTVKICLKEIYVKKNSPPQYLVPMGAPNNYHKAHMGQLYAIGLV